MTNTNELETITPRQLRKILFYLDGDKTIEEIRAMLFEIQDQDKQYPVGLAMYYQMKNDSED